MTSRVSPKRWVQAAVLCSALPLASCATYSERTDDARRALYRGDYAGSLSQWNKVLKVKKPEAIPNKLKKNHELVILERATVLQAMGQWNASATNFEFADKQLEVLDISGDTAGKIGKYIYSDSATLYKTSPTEKLSLNAMNLCNYLAQGDLGGAKVEAKRFTVMRNYLRDSDPEGEHGAFGSYLAGYVYEKQGDANEALRYYEEALGERDFRTLREVIPALASRGTYRGERIKDYLPATPSRAPAAAPKPAPKPEPAATPAATPDDPTIQRPSGSSEAATDPAPPSSEPPTEPSTEPSTELGALWPSSGWNAARASGGGEVLVVAKIGRVPYRIPERIPIGLAVGLAGAYVTGDTTLLEYGMFKFVVYPELVPSESLFETANVSIDGHAIPVDLASDLGSEIVAEYEDLKPKIIGAALTRMITRAAAAEGARAAGNQAEGAGGLVGFLAAAAVEGTLVALDKPDTRSWTTLPDRVFIGRSRVPAGAHKVRVDIAGNGGREQRTYDVTVPEGGFVVLDVTTLR
ncbi:MAG: hypothetical protein AAGA54_23750 [Myxococcota bacterium]